MALVCTFDGLMVFFRCVGRRSVFSVLYRTPVIAFPLSPWLGSLPGIDFSAVGSFSIIVPFTDFYSLFYAILVKVDSFLVYDHKISRCSNETCSVSATSRTLRNGAGALAGSLHLTGLEVNFRSCETRHHAPTTGSGSEELVSKREKE